MRRYKMGKALAKRPIDATKNIVQFNTAVPSLSVVIVTLAQGVNPTSIDESDPAKVMYVEQNAKIGGLTMSFRLFDESGVADSGSSVWLIRKNEGAVLGAPTLAQMNSLGTQTSWKAKIFHIEQAITGSQVSGVPMFGTGIKIPKRFHSVRFNDTWQLIFANNTANQLRACGQCIYKWYR